MRTLDPGRSQVNMIETRKREHSRKPDEQYDLIEACSPGPRLELFARGAQPGWDVWGNEAGKTEQQGRHFRGYEGGKIVRVPELEPHEHMAPELALRVGAALREAYEQRPSVGLRELATETGFSIARVHALLELAGTTFRGRGRQPNKGWQSTDPTPVRVPLKQ